jgi:DNA-binding MarR family transcriptional regulator
MAGGGRQRRQQPSAAAWRAAIVARVAELRPVVLALMRESVPEELQAGLGQATGRQLQALARLTGDGLTMGELAGFLKVTGAAASVLAGRLVAQGLAVRHADPADRRVVRLAPSPLGVAVAELYRDSQRRGVAALLDRLSDAQVAAWLDIMETLAASDEPAPAARSAQPAGAAR